MMELENDHTVNIVIFNFYKYKQYSQQISFPEIYNLKGNKVYAKYKYIR